MFWPIFISRLAPCNRGIDGEPCTQCTRRMLGHSRCIPAAQSPMIGNHASSVCAVGHDSPDQTVRTRTGRVSRPPKQDLAFSYTPLAQRPCAEVASTDNIDNNLHGTGTDASAGMATVHGSAASNYDSQPSPVATDFLVHSSDRSDPFDDSHSGEASISARRAHRKKVILSHLQQRAPLAVAAGAQYWDTAFFAREQAGDPDISRFLTLFKSGKSLAPWDSVKHLSATVRALWRQWDSLFIHDNVLYRRFERTGGLQPLCQLILPTSLRIPFLELIHADSAGHLKLDKCVPLVQNQAWWFTWRRDLRWYILCCKQCQAHIDGKPPHQALLTPLLHGEPRQRWSIDLTGPYPVAGPQRYKYMFTAVDCFTRFAIVEPIANKEAETVAKAVVDKIFLVHGYADLQADRGTEFRNQYLNAIVQLAGQEKFHTTAFKPSTNGKVEKFHRTFNSMLAKVVAENQRDLARAYQVCCVQL